MIDSCHGIEKAISKHFARGDFLNAHFVGYNYEAAVSNLFAEVFTLSKPCFYCTNNSFSKSHKLAYCLLITLFFYDRFVMLADLLANCEFQ